MTLDSVIEFKLIIIENIDFNALTYIIQTNLKGVQRTTK